MWCAKCLLAFSVSLFHVSPWAFADALIEIWLRDTLFYTCRSAYPFLEPVGENHEMGRFIRGFRSIRQKWRNSCVARMEILLLGALALGLFISCVGFFFGKPCSREPMMIGFTCAFLGAWLHSWQNATKFVLLAGIILMATALTFSYVGTDAITYHYPMQRLLMEGWNPVFQSSIERFRGLPVDGTLSLYHTLFLPKVSALCGALISCMTGLFSGDAFLGYVLIFALWRVSSRFAVIEWNCSRWASHAFAMMITFSSKITSFLAGQVDYTAYAAFVIGLFAFLTWRKSRMLCDLILSALGLSFAMLAKSTGMTCGVVAIVIGCVWMRKSVAYYRMLVAIAIFVLIVGASPLLTAWIQYGSPFYPSMTFDPNVQVVDITSDFVGNVDGESMGYLSRIVYAWFSKSLAVKGCALWLGRPDFAPEFHVCSGVDGFGAWFRLLMFGSVVAFACSRKNEVFYLALFIFFSANFAPLKYIGYGRYFSQIWIVPFLAVFNLMYVPLPGLMSMMRRMRFVVIMGGLLLVSCFAARTLAYQGRSWAIEIERQRRFESLKEKSVEWRLPLTATYTFRKRVEAAGIKATSRPDAPMLDYNPQFLMPGEDVSVARKFPICDSLAQLLHFPWVKCCSHIPKPL